AHAGRRRRHSRLPRHRVRRGGQMTGMLARADDIVIDTRSGAVTGAALHERLAVVGLTVAILILRPLHELGYSYVARLVRAVLPSRKSMVLQLADDSMMRIGYCDGYWSTMVLPSYRYEPAIAAMLADSADVDFGFIDGGANHGYWSILA